MPALTLPLPTLFTQAMTLTYAYWQRTIISLLFLLLPLYSVFGQPVNDLPCNAIPLPVSAGVCTSAVYTNAASTASGEPAFSCTNGASVRTVWFRFVAGAAQVQISTLTNNASLTLSGTRMSVYSGASCSALTQISCQEDLSDVIPLNSLRVNTTAGQTYWVMIDGDGGFTGTFNICVENLPNPDPVIALNQDCGTARFICQNTLTYTENPIAPAASAGAYPEPGPCFNYTIGEYGSRWFKFTSNQNGPLRMIVTPLSSPPNLIDYDFTVFDVTDGCTGTAIACNAVDNTTSSNTTGTTGINNTGNAGTFILTTVNVTQNSTYAILVNRKSVTAPATNQGFTLTFPAGTNLFKSPQATFKASTGCSGRPIQFSSNLTGNNILYYWNFGDGGSSTLANPSYTFKTGGAKKVTLVTVVNGVTSCDNSNGGSFNAYQQTINILNGPTVTVTSSDDTICKGQTVNLTGTATPVATSPGQYTFYNNTPLAITEANQNYSTFAACVGCPVTSSTIDVSGITPSAFANNMLVSVCVNIAHKRTNQLAVYLRCPGGGTYRQQLVEGMPTGAANTASVGVNTGHYVKTCFTFAASTPVPSTPNTLNPYSNNYAPQTAWGFPAACQANGSWSLDVYDYGGKNFGSVNYVGSLQSWNLTLQSQGGTNNVTTTTWGPTGVVSTTSGPTTTATPLTTTDITYTALDQGGCSTTQTKQIVVQQPPSIAVTTTNVSVPGGNDGSAAATLSGGSGTGYTYRWFLGTVLVGTTPSLTNLVAGIYKLRVGDSRGCVDSVNVIINDPFATSLIITPIITPVSCFGGANGKLRATVNGGNAPYCYRWYRSPNFTTPISTVDSAVGLLTGSYRVVVRDGNCSGPLRDSVSNITVTQPATALTLPTPTSVAPKCFGGSDGSATASPTGGTPPYVYLWRKNATIDLGSAATQTGLSANEVYNVRVTDARGCVANSSITLTQPDTLFAKTTGSTSPLCFGQASGVLRANNAVNGSKGGTTPYTYVWRPLPSGAAIGGNNPVVNSVSAGQYRLIITDANGCKDSSTVTLTNPAPINLTVSKTDVTVAGGNNGTATASATGGSGGTFTFTWTKVPAGTFTPVNAPTATNLSAGNYTVVVTENPSGCTATANVTINEPSTLTLTPGQANVSCFAGNDGSLSVIVGGGVLPYTYEWRNALNNIIGTTPTITNLSAGTYTVKVLDNGGAVSNLNFNLIQSPKLDVTLNKTDVTCFGNNNGQAAVGVTGGTPGYTYQWRILPSTILPNTGSSISNLAGGNYRIRVTDSKGCTADVDFTIVAPLDLQPAGTVTQIACFGQATGAANASVSTGGTPPYSFRWIRLSDGQILSTNNNITAQPSGLYRLVIIDSRGCRDSSDFFIPQNPKIVVTVNKTNLTCNGANNGSATVVPSGGSGSGYTFLWSTGATTSTINNLAPGTYNVQVRDGLNCTDTSIFTITEPPLLQANLTGTDVNCNGQSTGAISSVVTGGTLPYTYQWTRLPSTNIATTPNISNQPAGSYRLTVTDNLGCSFTQTVTIAEPADIVLTTVKSDATPPSFNNGSASVTPAGGVGPYTYRWGRLPANTLVGTNSSVSSLQDGTYRIVVTDSRGCKDSVTVVIAQAALAPLSLTTSFVAPNCPGSTNGQATVLPSAGIPPYSILWTGAGGNQTTSSISNLAPGTYPVQVTDNAATVVNGTVVIPSVPAIVPNVTITTVSCLGDNDGTAKATPTGGTPPYTYKWSPGGQTTDSISNLLAGFYKVIVTDSRGCRDSQDVYVSQPSAIQLAVTSTDVKCFGANDGTISVFAQGGTPQIVSGSPVYTYSWTPNTLTGPSVTGLTAGIYKLVVEDSKGCKDSVTVTLIEPSDIDLSLLLTPAQCPGTATGAATALVSGGTLPYFYDWTPGGATGAAISNIVAGNYNILLLDNNNCSKNLSFTVAQPPVIQILSSVVNVTCPENADGKIDIIATGGNSSASNPLTFKWSDDFTITSPSRTGLRTGSYVVYAFDSLGCFDSSQVIITAPDTLVLLAVSQNISCFGLTDGGASVNVSGGTAPYNYVWTGVPPLFVNSPNVPNLGAGNYTVTVTDNNGCAKNATVTVTEPAQIQGTATPYPACSGFPNGRVKMVVTGGRAPYKFNWGAVSTDTTDSISGVAAGSYTVTFSDVTGCSNTANYTIPTAPGIVLNLVKLSDAGCAPATNGKARVTVTSGTAPLTYQWTSLITNIDYPSMNDSLVNVGPDSVRIRVTSSNGCQKDTIVVFRLSQPPVLDTVLIVNPSCNQNNGSVTVVASSGTGPYIYTWNPASVTTPTLSGLGAVSVSVIATDSNGCTSNALSFTLVDQGASLNIGPDTTLCNYTLSTFTPTLPAGVPAGGVWTSPDIPSVNIATGSFNPVTVSKLTNALIYTVSGCFDTINITVDVVTANFTTVPVVPQNQLTVGQTISFTNASSTDPLAGPVTYLWDFGDGSPTSTQQDPTHAYTTAGTYSIVLTVTDNFGCTDTASRNNVVVINDVNSIIQNVFTPNGDGINDEFLISIQGVQITKVSIYDRLGFQQFVTTTNKGWTGFNANAIPVPEGTYYYYVEGTILDSGQKFERRGSVSIVR
jgi:large repetitive protein